MLWVELIGETECSCKIKIMRNILRIPIIEEVFSKRENVLKFFKFIWKLPAGQTQIGHPFYEVDTYVDKFMDAKEEFFKYWKKYADQRLCQAIGNHLEYPISPIQYHSECRELMMESDLLKF